MELRNERLSDEEFFRERKEVLAMWPTGKDVDLDEGVAYHKRLPPSKVYAKKLAEAKRNGDTLIYLYTGTPILEEQIEIVRNAVEEGGAENCCTHQDAFTRNTMFDRAEEAVKESIKRGRAVLNGFPIVIHGVAANRKLIESIPVASRISGCSCDGRLVAEIGFAGGHTGINFGPFFPFFQYNRDTTLETSIRNSQYRCRLIGYYEERGAPIIYMPEGGVLGGRVIEALMGAEQGVKHVSVSSTGGGSLVQALADAIAQRKLVREYLDRFGYKDVEVFTAFGLGGGHSIGRFPLDSARGFACLATGPLVAALVGIQECCVYTVDESHQIPTKEGQAASLRHGKMVINLYKGQKLDWEQMEAVRTEVRITELEIRAVIDRVIELGDGNVAIGSLRAFESGVLDTQFSTARGAARRCMMVRDAQGAWRYFDHGNLPFSKEIVEYHKEKIAERAKKEKREVGYEALIEDLLRVSGEEAVAVK